LKPFLLSLSALFTQSTQPYMLYAKRCVGTSTSELDASNNVASDYIWEI